MDDSNVLYLDNDKVIQKDIETPSATTGDFVAATGLAGIKVSISLTKGGAFLAGLTDIAMDEKSAMPGRYAAVLDGTVLRTALAAAVDTPVYGCISLPGDLRVWEEYMVREFRP